MRDNLSKTRKITGNLEIKFSNKIPPNLLTIPGITQDEKNNSVTIPNVPESAINTTGRGIKLSIGGEDYTFGFSTTKYIKYPKKIIWER